MVLRIFGFVWVVIRVFSCVIGFWVILMVLVFYAVYWCFACLGYFMLEVFGFWGWDCGILGWGLVCDALLGIMWVYCGGCFPDVSFGFSELCFPFGWVLDMYLCCLVGVGFWICTCAV